MVRQARHCEGQSRPSEAAHLTAKPIGSICNLRCEYCFYTEKDALFPKGETYRMPPEVLEAFIREYISTVDLPEVEFAWQGGEPTLMGLEFFREAVRLQNLYGQGKRIVNMLQTNGTLLDGEWCRFLAEHDFLVGLSLDGPEAIHNRYRTGPDGKSSFDAVLRCLDRLLDCGVKFNVICCVTDESAPHPQDIYDFFKARGVRFIQFIPIVERWPDASARRLGLCLATPPSPGDADSSEEVTPWSVAAAGYGEFLIGVFDEWIKRDVGSVFVMNFEWALCGWLGRPAPVCVSAKRCGHSLVIEHNGDVYACDHYVYPEYRLGNIIDDGLATIIASPALKTFGAAKEESLPGHCKACEVLFACAGGCPKHRFRRSPDGEPGLNYLCEAYKIFFHHIDPHMKTLAGRLRASPKGSDPT
jgi:uncharacterized protein